MRPPASVISRLEEIVGNRLSLASLTIRRCWTSKKESDVTITVNADKTVTGNATIAGMAVTVAHIHEATAGTNGAIIIPLVKTADNVWSLPPGARLSDSQYESYKAGKLYFNIHSEAHRSGEIRGQIKP